MKRYVLTALMLLTMAVMPAGVFAGSAAAAAGCGKPTDSKTQVLKGIGETDATCDDSGVDNIFATIVKVLSYVIGAVAIVMMLVGAFKYISSGGEAQKVGNAKSTILFALVGLIVAALAQFLVHFVLYQTSRSIAPKPPATAKHKTP